jgi:hypothetical protein
VCVQALDDQVKYIVLHEYDFSTVEDKVQTYFDNRLRLAAAALCRVTHQDPEELYGTLGAQVECERAVAERLPPVLVN